MVAACSAGFRSRGSRFAEVVTIGVSWNLTVESSQSGEMTPGPYERSTYRLKRKKKTKRGLKECGKDADFGERKRRGKKGRNGRRKGGRNRV